MTSCHEIYGAKQSLVNGSIAPVAMVGVDSIALTEFVINKPVLQEILNEVLQRGGK